jgi:hypothetical protein
MDGNAAYAGPSLASFLSIRPSSIGGISMHQDNRQLTKHYENCIAACWSCARICNTCSDDMIGMDPQGHDMDLMARCTRLCRECADVCSLSAQWMSRLSPLTEEMCRFCARVCDECAELCERHAAHHALCGPCGEECRRCASMCREMAGAKAA